MNGETAEILRGLVEQAVTDPDTSASWALERVCALLRMGPTVVGPVIDPSDAAPPAQTVEHAVSARTRELSALLEVARTLASPWSWTRCST